MKTFKTIPAHIILPYIFSFSTLAKRLTWFTFLLMPLMLQASIIYVNPSAAGANNGTTWADGFTSLATALQTAKSGDEIWVKKGLYKPVTKVDVNNNGVPESREATFQLPNGVALYGGFSGTETLREQRNIQLYVTILSGDIDNNDLNADANSIAEHVGDVIGNNAYHVIYTENVNIATRIDGFVITAGKAVNRNDITDANQDGGGWYNKLSIPVNASSPMVTNLIFSGNSAGSEGGAMYNTNAEKGGEVISTIQHCTFTGNKSNTAGGAIYLNQSWKGNYKLQITACVFTGNEAIHSGGALLLGGDHASIDSSTFENNKATAISPNGNTFTGSGGAVFLTASNASFGHCIFKGNSATGNPSGWFEDGGGGALYIRSNEKTATEHGTSVPKFISCGFYGNIASGNTNSWGGAVKHLSDGGKLSPAYINCVFSGNQAQDDGGAIANYTRVPGETKPGYIPFFTLDITNCTFTTNHAIKTGGAIYTAGYEWMTKEISKCRIENTIISENTAGKSGPEVYFTGNNVVANSLIKGSGGSGGAWKPAFGTDAGGNIDANPGFVNVNDADGPDDIAATSDDGLKLKAGASPVNKGNNAATGLSGITKDFQSLARINSGKVDLGAYERGGLNTGGPIISLATSQPAASALSIPEDKELSIFPIPAHSQFTISQHSLPPGKYLIRIYNTIGQLKRQENLAISNGGNLIAVKDLIPGYYVLQLVSGTGKTITKKLVIE